MNIATRVGGERIAKDVMDEAMAFEALDERGSRHVIWAEFCMTAGMGALFGWGMTQFWPAVPQYVGVTASAGYFLSLLCFQHIVRLRRRLDAAVVLLRISHRGH